MIKLVCAICFVTISISLLVNFLFLKYTGNKFAKNLPQNIVRWEVLHKPAIGGISFLCGPMISLLAISLFIPHYYIDTKQITSITLCLLICFHLLKRLFFRGQAEFENLRCYRILDFFIYYFFYFFWKYIFYQIIKFNHIQINIRTYIPCIY